MSFKMQKVFDYDIFSSFVQSEWMANREICNDSKNSYTLEEDEFTEEYEKQMNKTLIEHGAKMGERVIIEVCW